jgi:hypothetical protein
MFCFLPALVPARNRSAHGCFSRADLPRIVAGLHLTIATALGMDQKGGPIAGFESYAELCLRPADKRLAQMQISHDPARDRSRLVEADGMSAAPA